jgi:hypothetical protein
MRFAFPFEPRATNSPSVSETDPKISLLFFPLALAYQLVGFCNPFQYIMFFALILRILDSKLHNLGQFVIFIKQRKSKLTCNCMTYIKN